MRRDPLIIGAGPAGTAAAITLGQAGHRPILIERAAGPTDKVCGDFLSADSIQLVTSLGVDPAALGAAPIERVRLIRGERTAEATLPFPALGLTRRSLDAALLRRAEESGAEVRTGQAVRHLVRDSGRWSIGTGEKTPLLVETVFLATGKHDLRDLPRSGTARGAVGMKMYFALRPEPSRTLERAVELTLFPGGYAGLQPVENGHAVLCIAVQKRAFPGYGGGWAGLLDSISRGSRRFASMLSGARALRPRPLAVAGVPYGYQASAPRHESLFRLGDQLAVIPSLTGDGMAIALQSGKTAADTWRAGAGAGIYQATLARTLAPQMRLAGLLHHACMGGLTQSVAIRVVTLCPALLRIAATHTRHPVSAKPPRA